MRLPDDAIDRLIRNALALQRAHNAIARDASGIIRALFDEVVGELVKIDPTGPSAERYRRMRVEKLLERVEDLTGGAFRAWHRQVRGDLAHLGRRQGEEATKILLAAIGDHRVAARIGARTPISVNQMKAILDHNPFRGETLSGWAEVQEQATVRRIRQQVQIGMAENEAIEELVERIRGAGPAGRRAGGVLQATEREAEAIVRTAVTEVAAVAHLETYQQNRDVTTAYQYTATLDSRTSAVCRALDGKVFRYDDPEKKIPPQHWNCRSAIVPVVDWDRLGIEPPAPGTRASMDGPVPASLDYEGWLRGQSKATQNEILGPGRADLFREGVSLADMIRRDGSVIPLSELRR